MKKLLLSAAISLFAFISYGQDTNNMIDSMNVILSQRIEDISSSVNELRQNQINLNKRIERANREIDSIKEDIIEVDAKNATNETAISSLDNSVKSKIAEATETYQDGQNMLSSAIHNRTVFGSLLAFILAILAFLLYFFLRKRISRSSSDVESIRAAQKSLQEESLRLDDKLLEILDTQLKIQKETKKVQKPDEIDHSLALKVADELTRIEINLSRMDSSIRGYKQLSASLRRIKDNYLANGYEIIDMLGKPYDEGMKVIANFVPDESLKEGEQIITGIVKPQINYKGQMIQAAQITVSQN